MESAVESVVETPWKISLRHAAAKPREIIRRVSAALSAALFAHRASDPPNLPCRPCVVLCLRSPPRPTSPRPACVSTYISSGNQKISEIGILNEH